MAKRVAVGVVASDKMAKTRRVEIPRLVRHARYGKTPGLGTMASG